jgi:hypothetical protein
MNVYLGTCVTLVVLLTGIMGVFSAGVFADQVNPGVVSVLDKPYGQTYGDWSANWWQWVLSQPEEKNPLVDKTGELCATGQEGPVWFLGGTWGFPKVERNCTMPSGVAVLFPVYNGECSTAEEPTRKSYAELRECVIQGNLSPGSQLFMEAKVDGKELKNLENYRVESQLFNVTLPANNVFGVKEGITQAVADGWFIMLEPLSNGTHTLEFGAVVIKPTGEQNFQTHATYHLNVQ